MRSWKASSEVWMARMMGSLGSDLKVIVANDTKGDKTWRGLVPVYSKAHPPKEIRYISKLFKLFGFTLRKNAPDNDKLLRRLINRYSITHILCQYGIEAVKVMDTLRGVNLPIFVHFHGFDATFDLRSHTQPEKKSFSDDYPEKLKDLSRFAIFIANSEFTKNALLSAGIDSSRIYIKYLGVPLPEVRHEHKKIKGIQILQLGRLVDCKSPDRTIEAFELAKKKGLDGRLVIVGDGPLRTTCELLRERSPYKLSIDILGFVSWREAQQLLLESDIYTQHNIFGEISHQSEALGVSVLEAMSYGLPVVGTRNGGVLETVIDGKTGILNEPGDVEAQADTFLRLAHDPYLRQKMGDAGRERVAKNFSLENEAEELKNFMSISSTKAKILQYG